MILERFDAIFFIGDNMLRHIYTAFNILLRENIALGGLKQWEMNEAQRSSCRCENQFIKNECVNFAVCNNEEVRSNDAKGGHPSPYFCDRTFSSRPFLPIFKLISTPFFFGFFFFFKKIKGTPHIYLPITGSPAPETHHDIFTKHLRHNPESYKPIPVIHSLSLSTALRWPDATSSMDEWLHLVDNVAEPTARTVPFLWLGPVAAGHLKPPGQILSQGNNALWHYTVEMGREAKNRGMDVLDMYNLTLQATSWDGSSYGLSVGLVQAMMVCI